MSPDVSVVIVTWNGRQYLDACPLALQAQDGVDAEIVLVDNGSSDGTPAYVRARFPDGTPLDFGFLSKGDAKSQVALGHRKLKSQADATRIKAFWTEKLNALATLLVSS